MTTAKVKQSKARAVFRNRIISSGEMAAGEFLANSENWRIHPINQQQAIDGSLDDVGWVKPVLLNARLGREWPKEQRRVQTLVDGHLRVTRALARGGETERVPYVLLDLTPKEERLILATLDPIGGLASADKEQLDRLLGELEGIEGEALRSTLSALADDYGLKFDAPKLKVVDPEPLVQAADQLLKKWKVKPGDLWCLGAHRLLCGDAGDARLLERLFKAAPASALLMATDPPYLVEYEGKERPAEGGKNWGELLADRLQERSAGSGEDWLRAVLAVWQPYLDLHAAWYIWHASRSASAFERVLEALGIQIHQQLIWEKPTAVMGFSTYHWRHEPCFFGWLKGHRPPLSKEFYGRLNNTVWTDRLDSASLEDVALVVLEGSSVWHVDYNGRKRAVKSWHPTQKPIELFARPMRNHTRTGDVVAEPFCGSGSQVLAAESLGRVCYAMELSPAFCAVSLERYQLATGRDPVKE